MKLTILPKVKTKSLLYGKATTRSQDARLQREATTGEATTGEAMTQGINASQQGKAIK